VGLERVETLDLLYAKETVGILPNTLESLRDAETRAPPAFAGRRRRGWLPVVRSRFGSFRFVKVQGRHGL